MIIKAAKSIKVRTEAMIVVTRWKEDSAMYSYFKIQI